MAFRMRRRFGTRQPPPVEREGLEWRRARRDVLREIRLFRSARLGTERGANAVMNVKTLHGQMRGLMGGLQQVVNRLDGLEAAARSEQGQHEQQEEGAAAPAAYR